MAAVADYSIVTDNQVTISAPDHHDFPFVVDPQVNVGNSSVLSYMVEPAASGVNYTITIFPGAAATGTEVETRPLAAEIAHVRQEVIQGHVLHPGTATLRIEANSGQATFSDIVLMYQSTTP
jgi:hypothetical protein